MFKENLIYHTSLSPIEIVQRLQKEVEPESEFWIDMGIFNSRKPLTGIIDHSYFKIYKTPEGRRSAMALAEGRIKQNATETWVEVTMRPTTVALIFGAFSILSIFIVIAFWISATLQEGSLNFSDGFILPLFIPLTGLLVLAIGYWVGKFKLKRRLKDILEAEV